MAIEHLSHTTADTTDQADEEILTSTLSDDALEAAAGKEGGLILSNHELCTSMVHYC